MSKPLILSAPEPRTLDLIFSDGALRGLHTRYEVLEVAPEGIAGLDAAVLGRVRYVIGQPEMSREVLERMGSLRCIFNVEGNLINNMPYDLLFQRGVHVVTTGAVFAEPVAEMGLAMALCLARDVVEADVAFREGRELWGGAGNASAQLVSRSNIGIIGLGDLGRALLRLLHGFRAQVSAYDPWLPPSVMRDLDVTPVSLDAVLAESETVFVTASVTQDNRGFLDAEAFARMRPGARLILLSRADVVNFDDLIAAVRRGHILAASDVFPEEPLPLDHELRGLNGFLRSAHRAGAIESAFKAMGEMVLEDMSLLDQDLPPMRCKRAERETVARLRSMPVTTN